MAAKRRAPVRTAADIATLVEGEILRPSAGQCRRGPTDQNMGSLEIATVTLLDESCRPFTLDRSQPHGLAP